MRVLALSHHDPRYLKETYAHPLVDHVDDVRHIPTGASFIAYKKGYRAYRMPFNRTPILLGRFKTIHEAICATN